MVVEEPVEDRFVEALCVLRARIFEGSPAESSGLTPALAKALLAITDGGERHLRVRELAESLGIKESSASVLADRLVQAGLANKKPDPVDARALLVGASPSGSKLAEAVRLHRRRIARSLMEVLSREESQRLLEYLEKMGKREEY
ncbi:MAG TPA: MarR family transcriptional regulator [Spirochaetia bacterium]|nr:MarR family transcriptional regulator [Spirochaetales bacterium]HRY79464.1 MarR family transcriptional regulator [Spirochaetia bacterium]HRZ87970.1 MarR family transcriptional regulator [Spirochaetia bacterium]